MTVVVVVVAGSVLSERVDARVVTWGRVVADVVVVVSGGGVVAWVFDGCVLVVVGEVVIADVVVAVVCGAAVVVAVVVVAVVVVAAVVVVGGVVVTVAVRIQK